MKKLFALSLAMSLLATLAFAAPAVRQTEGRDMVDTMLTVDQFDTLLMLLRESGLTYTLMRAGPYTFFAPTNDAFNKLPPGKLDALLSNKSSLRRLLLSHVVRGRYTAQQAIKAKSLKTLAGGTIKFENVGGHGVIGDGAHFAITNIVTSNGLIQGIDTVLTPSKDTPDQP